MVAPRAQAARADRSAADVPPNRSVSVRSQLSPPLLPRRAVEAACGHCGRGARQGPVGANPPRRLLTPLAARRHRPPSRRVIVPQLTREYSRQLFEQVLDYIEAQAQASRQAGDFMVNAVVESDDEGPANTSLFAASRLAQEVRWCPGHVSRVIAMSSRSISSMSTPRSNTSKSRVCRRYVLVAMAGSRDRTSAST